MAGRLAHRQCLLHLPVVHTGKSRQEWLRSWHWTRMRHGFLAICSSPDRVRFEVTCIPSLSAIPASIGELRHDAWFRERNSGYTSLVFTIVGIHHLPLTVFCSRLPDRGWAQISPGQPSTRAGVPASRYSYYRWPFPNGVAGLSPGPLDGWGIWCRTIKTARDRMQYASSRYFHCGWKRRRCFLHRLLFIP